MRYPGFQRVPAHSPFSLGRRDCLVATIQGIEMVGRGVSLFRLASIDGWGGGVDTAGGSEEALDVDGGFATDVFYSDRNIVLEGSINGRDHEEFVRSRDRLERVLSNPRHDWLRIHESALAIERQILVYRSSPVKVTQQSAQRGIFTVQLRSVGYPRLAVDQSSLMLFPGESGRQENVGDYPAEQTVTLRGPLTNPRLTWSSTFWWQFNGTIPAGETRVVDMTRRIIRDPARGTRLDLAGTGTWPKVDPGFRTVVASGSGSGTVEMSWRSAWA